MEFEPADPFPWVPEDSHTYREAQAHSAQVDAWLGLRTAETEALISERAGCPRDAQHWIGLPVQALLTPYTELRAMLERLRPQPGQWVVDLGAGYGRMGFVLARHFPSVRFLGYEVVPERVAEGKRVLAMHCGPEIQLERVDLSRSDFSPAIADYYFIYDFGSRAAIEKTLGDLSVIARTRAIVVIGRGRASRDAIERQHPWLSAVLKPEHRKHYSIYRSG